MNGLVEGTNKLLIYILARLCAPRLGEDDWQHTHLDALPNNWPDHFDKAIRILNWRKLPALQFSPNELLLGLVVNTPKTPLPDATSQLKSTDTEAHMAYVAQQRLDGYEEVVKHATQRKAAFGMTKDSMLSKTFKVSQTVHLPAYNIIHLQEVQSVTAAYYISRLDNLPRQLRKPATGCLMYT